MAHAEAIVKNYNVLLRCTDVSLLIMACLRAEQIFDRERYSELEAEKSSHMRCCLLYEWLKESQKSCDVFLKVMENNEQEHVANLLKGEMKGPHVPLSEEKHRRLERITPNLMYMIHNNESLVSFLESKKAISKTDCQDIRHDILTNYKKNYNLINAILRRSEYSFACFEEALKETHQEHAFDYLTKGEVVALHVKTNDPHLDERLSETFTKLLQSDEVTEEGTRLAHLNGMNVIPVAARPGQSILVYLYCKTPDHMAAFIKNFLTGLLQDILTSILNRLLQKIGGQGNISKNQVSLDDEEVLLIENFTGMNEWLPNRFTISRREVVTKRQLITEAVSLAVLKEFKEPQTKELQSSTSFSKRDDEIERKEKGLTIEHGFTKEIRRKSIKPIRRRISADEPDKKENDRTMGWTRPTSVEGLTEAFRHKEEDLSLTQFGLISGYQIDPTFYTPSFTRILGGSMCEPCSLSEEDATMQMLLPNFASDSSKDETTNEMHPAHEKEVNMRSKILKHSDFLVERIDSNFGLLDTLVERKALTRSQLLDIKSSPNEQDRNKRLLDHILENNSTELLLSALARSGQSHLCNYLEADGGYRPDFKGAWPLTEKEISILDRNHRSLVDLLDTRDLIDCLYATGVITRRQRAFIWSKPTSNERNKALLNILKKRSSEDYRITIRALVVSNQIHIAEILNQGGMAPFTVKEEVKEPHIKEWRFSSSFPTSDEPEKKGKDRTMGWTKPAAIEILTEQLRRTEEELSEIQHELISVTRDDERMPPKPYFYRRMGYTKYPHYYISDNVEVQMLQMQLWHENKQNSLQMERLLGLHVQLQERGKLWYMKLEPYHFERSKQTARTNLPPFRNSENSMIELLRFELRLEEQRFAYVEKEIQKLDELHVYKQKEKDFETKIWKHMQFLLDRMDSDFGLLDNLLEKKALTASQLFDITSSPNEEERNRYLLNCILENNSTESLFYALWDSGQSHLCNYLKGDGEYQPGFNGEWPLTKKEIAILDANHRLLVDQLDTEVLIGRLFSTKVVNYRQLDFVYSKPTSHERNEALLKIFRKRSLSDYRNTIKALVESNQSHIAQILDKGGMTPPAILKDFVELRPKERGFSAFPPKREQLDEGSELRKGVPKPVKQQLEAGSDQSFSLKNEPFW